MVLRIERIDGMFDPFSFLCFGIVLLFVPIQSIAMPLPCYEVIMPIAIYVSHDNGNTGGAQLKFLVQCPIALPAIDRRFEPAIAYDKIATAIAVDIAKT